MKLSKKASSLTRTVFFTPVRERMKVVRTHESELDNLTKGEGGDLEKIGTLLCHASSPEMRSEYPIDGDIRDTLQSDFEVELFGTLTKIRGKRPEVSPGVTKPLPESFEGRGGYDV